MTPRPKRAEYRVRAKVWLYPGPGGWHFANLTPRQSHEVKVRVGENRRGWGSVPVAVKIGRTTWQRHCFPTRSRIRISLRSRLRCGGGKGSQLATRSRPSCACGHEGLDVGAPPNTRVKLTAPFFCGGLLFVKSSRSRRSLSAIR